MILEERWIEIYFILRHYLENIAVSIGVDKNFFFERNNPELDDSMLRTQITGKNSVTYKNGVKFRRYAGNGARKTENSRTPGVSIIRPPKDN